MTEYKRQFKSEDTTLHKCVSCRREYQRRPVTDYSDPHWCPHCGEGVRLVLHRRVKREVVGEEPPPKGERPKCLWCGKELSPRYETVDVEKGARSLRVKKRVRKWTGEYERGPNFHSQSCGAAWADRHIERNRCHDIKFT